MKTKHTLTLLFIVGFIVGIVLGFIWVQIYMSEYNENVREAYNECVKKHNNCVILINTNSEMLVPMREVMQNAGVVD